MFKKFRILTDGREYVLQTKLLWFWAQCYITEEYLVNFWQWSYSSIGECKRRIELRDRKSTWIVL